MSFLASDSMKKALGRKPKGEESHASWGHFFCPRCNNLRLYELKPASLDFTFYFIPLFETDNLDEFAVCLLCKKGFDPKVLKPDNQHLLRLAWVAKCELSHSSPETLKSKLLKNGLQEPLIDKLILLAQN